MPVIDTSTLGDCAPGMHHDTSVYCGLDCCVTLEALNALRERITTRANAAHVYDFLRALQGPFLEMTLRGFRIDEGERIRATHVLEERIVAMRAWLDELGGALGMSELNPRSKDMLREALCTRLHLPEHWVSEKGERKQSFNREALEWYRDSYLYAQPIALGALAARDTYADLKVLKTTIRNGRWHTSWNLTGTDTGRLSSSKAWDGTGSNIQNITRSNTSDSDPVPLRQMFIADVGRMLVSIDLKQSEAREVGFILGSLFDDWSYLDAIENGDVHTMVARLTWASELPWTGDDREDRKLAEDQMLYRNASYRDMAKKLSHGSSYGGTPYTLCRHTKCPQRQVERFQETFFGTFPAFPKWHAWIERELQTRGALTNLFGDTREFHDDPYAGTTLRKAIAYAPQSSTARRTNMGLAELWRREPHRVELLAQGHDSITFQTRECDVDEIVVQALDCIERTPELVSPTGRVFRVPGDACVGYNWAKATQVNTRGLHTWRGR